MKRLLLSAVVLSAAFSSQASTTPADGLKQAPDVICNDHKNQAECKAAINSIMFATYTFTDLDETCRSSSDAVKSKMDDQLKAQCASAKDAVAYLKTLKR